MFKKLWNYGYKHQRKVWAVAAIGFLLLVIQFFINPNYEWDSMSVVGKLGVILFFIGMGVGILVALIQSLYVRYKQVKNIINNR